MVRIGTWRKIRQVNGDLYEYENSKHIFLKVFRSPKQHVGSGENRYVIPASKYWAVSILRPRSLYQYLAGNSTKHDTSKKEAFKLAHAFMTLNP